MANAKSPSVGIPVLVRVCPECVSDRIVITMKTAPGFYGLCRECGHIWHVHDRDQAAAH